MTFLLRLPWLAVPQRRNPPAQAERDRMTEIPEVSVGRSEDVESPLVSRIRAGDVAAFESLYRRYVEALIAFATSYVMDVDVAEEIVQEVLCTVWERRADWAPSSTVRSYLFAAVRYRTLDHRRNQRIHHTLLARHEPPAPAPAILPLAAAEAADMATHVREAIAALSPERRRVLLLRWNEGLTYAEIAHVVGSSVKAVENQLNRTLKQLRQSLEHLVP